MARFARLDALRAYSAIAAFLFHANLVTYGWIGLQTFFVLSGFLITGILLDYKNRMEVGPFFATFYVRRALRIFPPYYVFLAISAVAAILGIFPNNYNDLLLHELPYLAGYIENIRSYDKSYINTNYYSHLWSLSTEEHFYLVWPFAIWFTPRERIKQLCLAVIVCAIVFRIGLGGYLLLWLQDQRLFQIALIRAPFCVADGLALGALAMLAHRGETEILRPALKATIGATIGASAIVLLIALLHAPARAALFAISAENARLVSTITWEIALLNLGAGRLILALCAEGPVDGVLRWFDARWAQSLGVVSYSFYIYHNPMLMITEWLMRETIFAKLYFVVAFVLTVIVAALSYRFVERPALALKDQIRFAQRRRIALSAEARN